LNELGHQGSVNVAARLEALAPPGGILVTRSVYEQVNGKIAAKFTAAGRHTVKNLARPLEAFSVAALTATAPIVPRAAPQARRLRYGPAILLAAIALLAVAVAMLAPRSNAPGNGPVSLAIMPLTTPDASDEATKRLAHGLTEDLITDLSRFPAIEIVASNTTAAWREKSADDLAIGKELNVRYLLNGSVQRQADELRVSAQLLDISTGKTIWSRRWERMSADAFAVQSELSEGIASALASSEPSAAIQSARLRKLKSGAPAELEAYDLYLLAAADNGRFTREANQSGIENATKAIELDPSFARAWAIRARLNFNSTHFGANYDEAMSAMKADAERAVALDPSEPEARVALAWYHNNAGQMTEASAQIGTALEQNPSNITVMKVAAAIYASSGRPEEAARLADKVIALDPLATSATLNTIKDAYFFSRRFADTVATIQRVPEASRSRGSRLLLALSLSQLARDEDFERAKEALLKAHPSISAEMLSNQGWTFSREEDRQFFLQAFKAAGLPVCASPQDVAKFNISLRLPGCS
jgi:TolB-like protein